MYWSYVISGFCLTANIKFIRRQCLDIFSSPIPFLSEVCKAFSAARVPTGWMRPAHKVGELCGITWNKNTIWLFFTRRFTTRSLSPGLLANHKLPNRKFHLQNLIKITKAKVVQKMMSHSWHPKPSSSFPLMASPLLALAEGYQGTRGEGLANHELSNQKFANKHQLFYIIIIQ